MQIQSAAPYSDDERRSEKRYLMAMPVLVQPVDEQSNAVGVPFAAMSRDISPKGVGLVHTEPIEHAMLALRMSLAGEDVKLITAVRWCRTVSPFYYVGAEFVSKLESFPEVVRPEP